MPADALCRSPFITQPRFINTRIYWPSPGTTPQRHGQQCTCLVVSPLTALAEVWRHTFRSQFGKASADSVEVVAIPARERVEGSTTVRKIERRKRKEKGYA